MLIWEADPELAKKSQEPFGSFHSAFLFPPVPLVFY